MASTLSEQSSRDSYLTAVLRVLYTLGAFAMLSIIAVWTNDRLESARHTDECIWQTKVIGSDTVLTVVNVFEGGDADSAGIREGDIVLGINGESIEPAPGRVKSRYAQTLLNDAPTDHPIEYVVQRDGQVLTLHITLSRIEPVIQIIFAIFCTLWLLIGLIVGLTRPRGYVQVLFFLTGLTVFFSFSGTSGPLDTPGWQFIWSVAGSVFSPAWVLFTAAFPVRQKFFKTNRSRSILFIPSIITFFAAVYMLIGLHGPTFIVNLVLLFLKIILVIYFGIGVWLLFRANSKMPAGSNKRPMHVILIGTVTTACLLLYLAVMGPMQLSGGWNPLLTIPALLFLALPFSFGFVIFRYQMMDVRAVVKTAVVYTLTTGAILGVYISLAVRISNLFGSMLGDNMERIVQVATLAIFLVFFEPTRRWIQRVVDRRFFPQYRDYSEHLAEYAAEMTQMIGVPDVAELMARTLHEHLGASAACVATVDEEGRFRTEARIGGAEPEFGEDGAARLQELLGASSDLIVLNATQDQTLTSIVESGFAYALGLYAGGRLIGAVLLGRRSDGKPIIGSQVPFINGVASQGASGIEAARLYERELARRRYEEQLATARRIQQSLLPTTMPDIPGISISAASLPAMAVGGDYYEVIRLSNSRFLAMIADVSGKGLPASLYMAELHGMVRVAASIRQTPREMLRLLNDHLCTTLERGTFITATIALFDRDAGTATIARSGHTPIVRRRGSTIDRFAPTGLPLGIRSQELYATALEEITLEYLPGDRFLLYSDGVSEAMNERREEFGDERLASLLTEHDAPQSVQACTDAILRRVEEFRGDAEQNDDITVLVVGVDSEENEVEPEEVTAVETAEVS